MSTPHWSIDDVFRRLRTIAPAHSRAYFAMYNSIWDAIVTDPQLMCVPVDDHLLHRGDGVFETLLAEEGALYNLDAHLQRLASSAAAIGIACPAYDILRAKTLDVFRAAGQPRALGRILLGRGPGGFAVDPRECLAPSLYIIVYAAPPPFMERNPGGASVVLSQVPPKTGGLATIKTCNYLPNVLMKMEAIRAGAHFVLGVDSDGFLTESYTENFAAVDRDGALLLTPAQHHLPGTTLARVADLARAAGRPVRETKLRPADLDRLAELLVVGTTAYVTRVSRIDGRPAPQGPVAEQLDLLLHHDILRNPTQRTVIRDPGAAAGSPARLSPP